MKLPWLSLSFILSSVLFLTLCGCGKKGALVPPEALVPAPIGDLAVAQKGGQFQVSWSAPSKEAGGARLRDLAGFILFRRIPPPPDLDCEECPGAYSQLARVDLDYMGSARRVGNQYFYDDHDLKKGKTYQYKIRSLTTAGAQSGDSNKPRRTAATAPLPPVLEALSSSTGVVLAFVALPPEEGKPVGYNVYRAKIGEPMPLLPLTPQPVTGTTYEDKKLLLGVHYIYTVTAVAVSAKGETVESAHSNPAEGTMLERD